MIEEKLKRKIDEATYEELLRWWRFAPIGDPMFLGETGEYYSDSMFRKKSELGHAEAVQASKNVGWN